MAQAKQGDTVKVHYTGKFEDGTVFDTSMNREPLEFTIGEGQLIPGFEKAVVGMEPGQSLTTEVPAAEAYGPYDEEMLLVVEKDQFPADVDPQVDQQLQVRQADGRTFVVRVTDVSDSEVTLDANHPLAGEDLTFEIELVEIV
jgi:peptidylprolyl isomerase